MKNFHKFAPWVVVLALWALPAFGLDTKALKPTGYVNDFSSTRVAPTFTHISAWYRP